MNLLHFYIYSGFLWFLYLESSGGVFFAIFIFLVRIIRWQFLLFNGKFLKIFTFLKFSFGDNWQKILLVRVNVLNSYIWESDKGYFIWKFVRVCFWRNSLFFFRVIRWHLLLFESELLKTFTILRFYFGYKGQKITPVRVNPFKFWYSL